MLTKITLFITLVSCLLVANSAFAMPWEDFQKMRQDAKQSSEIELRTEIYLLGIYDGIVGYNGLLNSIGEKKLYCLPSDIGGIDAVLASMDITMVDMKQRYLKEPSFPNPEQMEVSDVMSIALMKYACPNPKQDSK